MAGTETEERWRSLAGLTGLTQLSSVTLVALISPHYQCGPLIGAKTELRPTYVIMLTYISSLTVAPIWLGLKVLISYFNGTFKLVGKDEI